MNSIKINDIRLDFMRPVLDCLQTNYCAYNAEFPNDCLYWYNERANVGAFASAIWKAGGLALEEYSSKKADDETEWQGRADLFFRFDKKDVLSEAKILWLKCPVTSKRDFLVQINRKLEFACSDTIKSLNGSKYFGLGLLFVVPYWHVGYDATKDIEMIDTGINGIDSGFIMMFSHDSKNIVSLKKNVCNYVYVIGKFVHNCHR